MMTWKRHVYLVSVIKIRRAARYKKLLKEDIRKDFSYCVIAKKNFCSVIESWLDLSSSEVDTLFQPKTLLWSVGTKILIVELTSAIFNVIRHFFDINAYG